MSNNPTINELQNATNLSENDYLVIEQDCTKKITLGDLVNEVSKISGIAGLEERVNEANSKANELSSKVAEVFQSVSNNKTLIASAVADLNLDLASDVSLKEIINKIHEKVIISDDLIIENDKYYYIEDNRLVVTGYGEVNVNLSDNTLTLSIDSVIPENHTVIVSDGITRKEFEFTNITDSLNVNCEIPESMTDKTLYITIKVRNTTIGTVFNKGL